MCIRNKFFSLIFKVLIVIIGIFGIYSSLNDSPLVGIYEHLSYYTNLSNLLCILFFFVYSIIMLLNIKKEYHNYCPNLKGAITITILITFIVYNLVLRPFMHNVDGVMKINSIGNTIVHVILPIMVLLDYILFDEKGRFNKKKAYTWVLIPLMYFIFICIRAKMGGMFTYAGSRYPYFFLDIDEYGIPQVTINVIISIILILLLIYLYIYIDSKLHKKISGN